jgi:adenosine deaminase
MATAVQGGYFEGDGKSIIGLGLDSSEVGFRPDIFKEMYAEGKKLGLRRTAHAGEEGDPSYISGALDSLHAERIDHGIRLTEEPDLLARIVKEEILLTVCPLSNVCLRAVKSVGEVPIRKFLEEGVRFSINSDDPAYFGGYILANYCAVQEAFGLSMGEWERIAGNAIEGSWCTEERKGVLKGMLGECMEKFA